MRKRILTGDRTTGKLHLGHYVGSLLNRVKLQNEYETFILLADIQALTTHFNEPKLINASIYDVAIDNLSVGLDPQTVYFVQQSLIPAIAELTVFYSMITTVNSLRHNPTIKTEIQQYGYNDVTYGFLGYPVSQAADITFCNAELVPVGEDQLPHLEQTRKIVRKFNSMYSHGTELIKEPKALLSKISRLPGLDGNSKMGKSQGNAIYLSDSKKEVNEKIRNALTDANRIKLNDKGNPDICTVAGYHSVFNHAEYQDICEMCKQAKIGCVACKSKLAGEINTLLEPIREKRAYYENNKKIVREIIFTGSHYANNIGNEMVRRVKANLHLSLE